MNHNLEQFIRNNREAFDSDHPADHVWDAVEARLPTSKKDRVVSIGFVYKMTAAAAVVCIVLTSAYFVYIGNSKIVQHATTAGNSTIPQSSLINIAPEYASQISQVNHSIRERRLELKEATANNPELYRAFLSDLQVLDSTYQLLQKQAATTPNRDIIIKAMMQNLKLQSELLHRQLTISNDLNQNEKHSVNEKKVTSATEFN